MAAMGLLLAFTRLPVRGRAPVFGAVLVAFGAAGAWFFATTLRDRIDGVRMAAWSVGAAVFLGIVVVAALRRRTRG